MYGFTVFRGIPARGGGNHAHLGIKSSPATIRWLARMYKVRRLSHPKFVLQKSSTGFWTVSETHLPLYKLVGFVLFSKSDWKSAVGVEVCV